MKTTLLNGSLNSNEKSNEVKNRSNNFPLPNEPIPQVQEEEKIPLRSLKGKPHDEIKEMQKEFEEYKKENKFAHLAELSFRSEENNPEQKVEVAYPSILTPPPNHRIIQQIHTNNENHSEDNSLVNQQLSMFLKKIERIINTEKYIISLFLSLFL